MFFLYNKQKLILANLVVIKVRWIYYSILILTGIFSKIIPASLHGNTNFSITRITVLILLSFSLNTVYYMIFIRRPEPSLQTVKLFSVLQIVLDALLNTIVIYQAGGIISVSFIYYIFMIASSGFIFTMLGVMLVTLYCGILYGGLIFLQYFNVIPYLSRYGTDFEYLISQNFNGVFTNVFTIVGSFFMIGLFVSLMSETVLKKEKEVEKEKNKEEAILENLLDGLIYQDSSGNIDMANPMAAKLLDFKLGEVVGKNIKKINFSKLLTLRQVFKVPVGSNQELTPMGKPDQILKVSAFPILDKGGNEIGSARLIHDRSREKFVDKMKSEFITIAGHQLRTPLSAIKGAVHMLKKGDMGEINDDQAKILEHTYEYTENLIRIVNDLLNVSSIEEGKFDYDFQKVDIHSLIFEVTERFADEAEAKRINFNVKILNNLEQVELDPEKIKLALGALVSNAVTYTAEGGFVNVVCGFENNKLSISVEDSGIGIPEHLHEKVFTKFFRADNALKFNTEGNGLDLFVAKNIIDNHGGRIWFKSEFNEGSAFYIELPLKQK